MPTPADIVRRAVAGERRWLARAITLIELRQRGVGDALAATAVRRRAGPGAPHVIGLTGPPGAGKSTLVDRLITRARAEGRSVAVVAVDPSSPFSGGAILGDRVRMEKHTADDGVYVRSLSSRGHLGGLSSSTTEVVDLLDATGFDDVLVETVGVGQSELGVMEVADTAVVILTPESGDSVQAMKAGLLEIADVFVVNKSDRPGAGRLAHELERSVALSTAAYKPPVLLTSARDDNGIDAVLEAVRAHRVWSMGEGLEEWRRRRGDARVRLYLDLVAERARSAAGAALSDEARERLLAGTLAPQRLVGES